MTIQLFGGLLLLVSLLKLIDVMVDDPSSGHYARRDIQVHSTQASRVWLPINSSFAVKGKTVYIEKMGPVWCIFSLTEVARGIELWYLAELRQENCESKRSINDAALTEREDSMGMSTSWVVMTDRSVRAPTAIVNIKFDPKVVDFSDGFNVKFPLFTGAVDAAGELFDFILSAALFNHSYLSFFPMTIIQGLLRVVIGGMAGWALWKIAGNVISGLRGR